jgi:hypothetical protein
MQALVCAAVLLVGAVTYNVALMPPAAGDDAGGNLGSGQFPPSAAPPKELFAGVLDEHPAIQYATREPRDPVARLRAAIAQGSISLAYREPAGYLHALLQALAISPESQLLVFSKTGLQRAHTGPLTPRALYFNDSVVVGYIPAARFLEIAAHDPEQGVMFYTVDQAVRPAEARERAAQALDIARGRNCLTCHVSGATLDVPGLIARSNFVDGNGGAIPQLGFHIVDHRTPLAQRWGGWFVTGRYDTPPYGGVGHMGSVSTTRHAGRGDVAATSNEVLMRWLDSDIEEYGYPSHESDIAALMVFDHQVRAINLLTRLNWEVRVAAADGPVDFSTGALADLVAELVDYFLFVGEAPPPARLTPRAGFAEAFKAAGRRDSHGRSLRELDLNDRLLRYSCSYMIDSAAFDHLPPEARTAVYAHLAAILSAETPAPKYAHLTAGDRRAMAQILRETKPDWPRLP